MPLLWTARLLGIPISERVAGSTFRVPPFAWYLQRHKADADRLATAALVMLGSSVLSSWGRYDRQVISLSSVTYASIYAL